MRLHGDNLNEIRGTIQSHIILLVAVHRSSKSSKFPQLKAAFSRVTPLQRPILNPIAGFWFSFASSIFAWLISILWWWQRDSWLEYREIGV